MSSASRSFFLAYSFFEAVEFEIENAELFRRFLVALAEIAEDADRGDEHQQRQEHDQDAFEFLRHQPPVAVEINCHADFAGLERDAHDQRRHVVVGKNAGDADHREVRGDRHQTRGHENHEDNEHGLLLVVMLFARVRCVPGKRDAGAKSGSTIFGSVAEHVNRKHRCNTGPLSRSRETVFSHGGKTEPDGFSGNGLDRVTPDAQIARPVIRRQAGLAFEMAQEIMRHR